MFGKMNAAHATAASSADMEDFGQPSSSKAGGLVARTTKRDPKGKQKEVIPEVEVPLPDATKNYPGWITGMRKRWKKQREARVQNARLGGVASDFNNSSISSMFRQRTMGLNSLTWEVVQISATPRPGLFNLWLLIDNSLQKVKLRIPRQFYLNLRAPPEDDVFLPQYQADPLVRTLPRNHPCLHLFRITVDEKLYLEGESHFSNLINNPKVDGVYELQVGLSLKPDFVRLQY